MPLQPVYVEGVQLEVDGTRRMPRPSDLAAIFLALTSHTLTSDLLPDQGQPEGDFLFFTTMLFWQDLRFSGHTPSSHIGKPATTTTTQIFHLGLFLLIHVSSSPNCPPQKGRQTSKCHIQAVKYHQLDLACVSKKKKRESHETTLNATTRN